MLFATVLSVLVFYPLWSIVQCVCLAALSIFELALCVGENANVLPKAIGLEKYYGKIKKGYFSDFVVLDEELNVMDAIASIEQNMPFIE